MRKLLEGVRSGIRSDGSNHSMYLDENTLIHQDAEYGLIYEYDYGMPPCP